MIQCIFTLDYEIYGNGEGSLKNLVLDPTKRLADLFKHYGTHLVFFVEALEFARMEETQSDPDISEVRFQLRNLRASGHEIGLHTHPWWANATYQRNHWLMDWREQNICMLNTNRIEAIVSEAIRYLRVALEDPLFTPISFRSGLWAMQPTASISRVLAKHGVRVDASVFKGGHVRGLGLDYRPALKNEGIWRFGTDVNRPDTSGPLWEIPIFTEMVPFWKMLGGKRLKLQNRVPNLSNPMPTERRWLDYFRFLYPRKLDFCRMTYEEMEGALGSVLRRKHVFREEPQIIVAIGHSKDLVDFEAIERFLDLLCRKAVNVTTFSRLIHQEPQLLF